MAEQPEYLRTLCRVVISSFSALGRARGAKSHDCVKEVFSVQSQAFKFISFFHCGEVMSNRSYMLCSYVLLAVPSTIIDALLCMIDYLSSRSQSAGNAY
jgi:hypothetical protein